MRQQSALSSPELSADAQRVLNRIPTEWNNEREIRQRLREGLLLRAPAIAQILNGLERRGLIERGAWLADGRPIRRAPAPSLPGASTDQEGIAPSTPPARAGQKAGHVKGASVEAQPPESAEARS